MAFAYQQLYGNGLNNNSQIRRSVDFIYQRGGTYEVVLVGDSYQSTMELIVNMFINDNIVGQLGIVPYKIEQTGTTYYYHFNIRPYNYLQSYVNTEHYQYYWLNDFVQTSMDVNVNPQYTNGIKASFKYAYRYYNGLLLVNENIDGSITNDLNHYTYLPESMLSDGFFPSGYTNTGNYFDYQGGTFEFDNNFILQNFDQEVGTIIGTGFTGNTLSIYNRLSPVSQYLMDYPTVPEQSETGRFLTDAPRIQYIQDDENYVLWYLNGQTGDRQVIESGFAVIQFYSGANTLLHTVTQDLRLQGTVYQSPSDFTDTLKRFALPCGPVDIKNLYYSGVNWNDIAYYRVQICYGLPTWDTNRLAVGPIGPISEIFYFYLYNNCLPENTRICWLNAQGGYDYFTFQSFRQDTKKIQTTSYDNRYYATNIQSPDRNVGRSNKTFDTNVTQEITIDTDYLSVAQSQWLEQLFISPQVYIMDNDYISPIDRPNKIYKDLKPVQIISTSVDTMTKKHSKLNKYRLTLKTADNYFVAKGF